MARFGSVSPAAWRSASHAASAWTKAATAAAPATVDWASGTRSSSVPNIACGRSSHHQRRGSGTTAAAAAPQRSAAARPFQLAIGGGSPCRGKQLGDRRPRRGKAGVRTGVEGRIGGEGGELREVAAQAVVHRERPLGTAHGHVHLEGTHELPAGNRAVLGERPLVPFAAVDFALGGGERMHTGRRGANQPGGCVRERLPRGCEVGGSLANGGAGEA